MNRENILHCEQNVIHWKHAMHIKDVTNSKRYAVQETLCSNAQTHTPTHTFTNGHLVLGLKWILKYFCVTKILNLLSIILEEN